MKSLSVAQITSAIQDKDLTPDELTQLQAQLIKTTQEFAHLVHILNQAGLSLHIAPDMSYISREHELDVQTGYLIRKSPACHEVIIKI